MAAVEGADGGEVIADAVEMCWEEVRLRRDKGGEKILLPPALMRWRALWSWG